MKYISNYKNKKILIITTPVILYFILILNGVLGIDFGIHWDEGYFISQAANAISTGALLPAKYAYPSFCYIITLSAAEIYKLVFNIENASVLNTDNDFKIFLRLIFMTISSLTVFWVYWLTLKVSKNYLTALIAGLIILTSFEFSYHSRWAVTDTVAVQFTILSSLILFLGIGRNKTVILSSLIAGVAMGTKYTAGIISINILFYILTGSGLKKADLKKTVKELFLFIIIFLTGFIITTPGIILDNGRLINDVLVQKNMYNTDGHIGHTVQAGFSHFFKINEYILFELFSKSSVVSLFIFIFSIVGFIWALMRRKWLLSGLLVTMFLYIIYISSFKVMLVRNLLFVLPFFAIFASLGFYCFLSVIRNIKIKYFFTAIILITLVHSCLNVFSSSFTIWNKSKFNSPKELYKYLKQNSDKHFVFSRKVLPLVGPEYINTQPSQDSYLVFNLKEYPFYKYTANIRNQFVNVIGMEDININYYPTWGGDDRIVIMKYRFATEDILDLAFDEEDFTLPESLSDSALVLKIKFIPQEIDSSSYNKLFFNDSLKAYIAKSESQFGFIDSAKKGENTYSYNKLVFNTKMKAYIVNSEPPYILIDSAKSRLDPATLTTSFNFTNRPTGKSYLVIKHRRNLNSWSKLPLFNSKENIFSYTFYGSEIHSDGENMNTNGDSNVIYPIFTCDIKNENTDLLDEISFHNLKNLSKICP